MNYGQLKAAIANRLGRTNLTAVIPDFITLGESRLYFGFKDIEVNVAPLRLNAMLATESVSLTTLPADFLEVARFTVPDSPRTRALTYVTPEEFANINGASSYPRHYTMQDGGVAVEGGTPTAFTFSYYKRFDALASDADTNWILTNYPNVYLYSALIEAYAHIKDDARLPTAGRMYAAAANALIDADSASRHSGSTLSIPSAR